MNTVSVPSPRPMLRSVALPTEHGGWGLTLEPVLLGLLVAPSVAGLAIGGAAFLVFVAVNAGEARPRRPIPPPPGLERTCAAGDLGRGSRARTAHVRCW